MILLTTASNGCACKNTQTILHLQFTMMLSVFNKKNVLADLAKLLCEKSKSFEHESAV